ncbi:MULTISPECIES: helix-turn-helix domain-containing protein [Actinomadura]|uniref:Helix-turn-helix domain-containing protein n=1 Tax=Actinomadura yumaensis TaxID=111807 RepID=A0ABW2CT42_9ACTN|nr:helix-turn-helix transcriptional regulator [Actinomadura sp. J1-007]MWK37704.1 helix-turn-helix domain-containing protein [Actinomadura sp. J1-007]
MPDGITIGTRLRALRRWRGMSLDELAGLTGLSKSFLSRAERGQRTLDRRSHLAALASALRISESDLVGGPHLSADPVQSAPHTHVPALRVALQSNSLLSPATDRARPLPDLAAALRSQIEPLRRACDYTAIGALLPDILDELHVHVAAPADEAVQRQALELLVEACVCAAFTAKNLGYVDLAYVAANRAMEAARFLNDPVQIGKAEFLRAQTMPKTAWDRVLLSTERAADALEPHVNGASGHEVLGMLTLSASLAAASVRDGERAEHWLDEARRIAARVPDEPLANWQSFSATNVGVWDVTVGVERGVAGAGVLELTGAVREEKLGRSSRRAAYLADVGRGLARDPRTRGDAVRWLQRAERVAPQRIRNSVAVRESIAVMLEQARVASQGRELRGMAARMGVPH